MTRSLAFGIGAALDLGEGVAKKLKEIADKDLIDELANALAQDRPKLSSALSRVLSATGFAEVQEFLGRAAGSLESNRQLRRLTARIAGIPRNGIGWTWRSKAAVPGKDSVAPSLTGSARGSARILRGPGYSFRGALGVTGGLKSPLPAGSLSTKAERSRRGALRVDFSHPEDMRVIEAACLDLPVIARLSEPLQLRSARGFRKATLEFSGAVRLGAEFKAASSLLDSLGASGTPVSQRLQTRLRYAVDWTREGSFRLGIRRIKGGRLRLRLTEAQRIGNQRSLSIGAEMRVRGLREAVAPVMRRITGLPEGLEELVRKYSQPSRIFEKKFKERTKLLDARAQSLLSVVSGSLGADDPADGLAGAISEVARFRAENWTEMLDGKVDGVIEKALAKVEIAPERAGDIAALVKLQAREALDALNDEIEEKLAALVKAQAGADTIGATLAQFADARDDAANRMDGTAAALTAPLRVLLAHYRATEQLLESAVETVEKGKLAAKFARVSSRESKSQALLVFDLNPSDAQAEELYRQMLSGDFRGAMKAASDRPNGAIKLRDGAVRRVFDDHETSGVTFNLFGLEMASERKLSARIRVEHDLGGQIDVLEAEGSVSEGTTAFGEGQSMRVDSLLNFLTAPDSTDALAVQLNYTDAKTTVGELHQYVQSLEEAGLIAEGAALRLTEGNTELGVRDGRERLIRIDTRFALTRAAFQKIGQTSDNRIIRVAIRQQLRAYGRMDWASQTLALFADLLNDSGTVEQRIHELRGFGRRLLARRLGIAGRVRPEQARKITGLAWSIANRAKVLASFVELWRQLNRLRLNLDQQVGGQHETLLAEARKLHSDMLAELRSWTDARGPLVGLAREDLSPIAAAFLASLRELSGPQAEPLTPILTCTTNGQPQHIAIT